ncbi:hypothetical protein aq_512 [Aquifex aeolicus VF5]|uniref:Alpha-D-phosphohexomutase alpha/beta/alpha domain-containing protein n=1 Tax=Aquifex aeolicus (strain VF5) TaxID=224324 RepID=O66800_AQUAE|nr:hypothetical protein aq_512 [Aquifex aeolicus VF5]
MEQGYRTISRKTLRPLQKDIRKITFLCKAECSRKRIIQYSIMIKFGTDGWRARIAEEFNFDNVRRVAKAHAEVLKEKGVKRVIVGYDWRFRSEDFAKAVYDVFRSEGLEAKLVGSACTTPMVSFAVKYLGYENGVMITASHNPPAYNGYKIKESFGGSATPEFVKSVEEKVKDLESVEVREFEPEYQEVRKKYVEKIREFFDMDLFKEREALIVHDSLHGSVFPVPSVKGYKYFIGLYLEEFTGKFLVKVKLVNFVPQFFQCVGNRLSRFQGNFTLRGPSTHQNHYSQSVLPPPPILYRSFRKPFLLQCLSNPPLPKMFPLRNSQGS